jgi:Flp pilus assembly protein TadG
MVMSNFIDRFRVAKAGNVSMMFGLAILPLFGMVGAAVDIQSVRSERQRMQDALDAATLAVMSHQLPATIPLANRELQRVYAVNGGKGTARFTTRVNAGIGNLSGQTTATYTKPTMIMGIMGFNQTQLQVGAAAETFTSELQSVAFRLNHITGAYDKRISLMATPVGGSTPVELMRIYYNNPNAQPGGTTTISKMVGGTMTPVARKVCTNGAETSCTTTILAGDGTAEVDLKNMDRLYLEMEVSASNPIAAAYLWPGMPRIIRTNNPALSYRLFIGGEQVPYGSTVDLGTSVPCGIWSSQDWEDGGNNGLSLLLTSTDVHYDVRGNCTSTVTGRGARLTQ